MKNIKFIVPYYGTFPEYFKEWLYTASKLENQNVHFLLITDLEMPCAVPNNFEVQKMSFDEIRELFQKNFDFPIALNSPYKFCDFRPAFGEIFSKYLEDVDFWGHCDIDMIWGDIRRFITDEVLESNEKIQYMGHFVLYKNVSKVNSLYKESGALSSYREVFSREDFYSFDEHPGIMSIIIKHPIKVYIATNQADFSPAYRRLFVSRVKNYPYQIFCWCQGHVYRYYLDKNENVMRDEFMYAHFQKRKMKSLIDNQNDSFLITNTGFKFVNINEIDADYIKNRSDYVSAADDSKALSAYKKMKICDFLTCSMKKKIIWIKIKMYTRKVNKYFKKVIFQSN